jgi:dephospho-CoA kinase
MGMLRVGLTGGIASGKTTVAALLRKQGCQVLDADLLGHDLMMPGQPAYDEIVREFGEGILTASRSIDRAKLGALVFADQARRLRLNEILHPPIRQATQEWFVGQSAAGADVAFVEAALLIEAGYRKDLDRLVVCWSRADQQLERLLERGFSKKQAEQRIAAQMPGDEKRRLADRVIDCSGTLAKTERQVIDLLASLRQEARAQNAPSNIS